MTNTSSFAVSRARDAVFDQGLRAFFAYRDLGIQQATGGRVVAHVIRAVPGGEFTSQLHLHRTSFQMVYVLKGWITFDYEGHRSSTLSPCCRSFSGTRTLSNQGLRPLASVSHVV